MQIQILAMFFNRLAALWVWSPPISDQNNFFGYHWFLTGLAELCPGFSYPSQGYCIEILIFVAGRVSKDVLDFSIPVTSTLLYNHLVLENF